MPPPPKSGVAGARFKLESRPIRRGEERHEKSQDPGHFDVMFIEHDRPGGTQL